MMLYCSVILTQKRHFVHPSTVKLWPKDPRILCTAM